MIIAVDIGNTNIVVGGIEVDHVLFTERLSTRTDFAMDVCPDPGFLLMSGNTCNYVAYRSTTMDALFKKLRTQVTQADYQSVLYDIQEQFAKDCPFICLYYRGGTVLTRRMYTTTRDVREGHLLDGIESFYD